MAIKPFTTDDIVELQNIDDEDFEFSVFGVDGYLIPAGQTEKMPGYMATLCLKHLCDIVMQKRGETQMLNNPIARAKVYDEIFVGVEPTLKPMPKNDAQRAQAEFEAARNGKVPSTSQTQAAQAGVEDELADGLINSLETTNAPEGTEPSAFAGLNV